MKVLILDFYVDEPACFGVPPYISTYVRYLAGALAASIPEKNVHYLTIDQLRGQNFSLNEDYAAVFIVMGSTVPGKYLGGKIGTIADLNRLFENPPWDDKTKVVVGGPVQFVNHELRENINKHAFLVSGDIEPVAARFAQTSAIDSNILKIRFRKDYEQINDWAVRGAFITTLHPNFPDVINEMETYRGCTRDIYCSFCTEAFYGRPVFRETSRIAEEFSELYRAGNSYFRLGRQADLLTYLPDMASFSHSFPRPVPANILELYTSIHRAAPGLKLLHLDNINPGVIHYFPNESAEVIRIISEYNTHMDTAAMGLESIDPVVVSQNQLKINAEQALGVIRLMNEVSHKDEFGIPKLLPGLNFISGLSGETTDTFRLNYDFLKKVYDEGLLLRRINIRQVVPFKKTALERSGFSRSGKIENRFRYYRDKIRDEIDEPMLKRLYPQGYIIKNVIVESIQNEYYLGRALGSYPITVKIIGLNKRLALYEKTDVVVMDYMSRSVLVLPTPIPVNKLNVTGYSLFRGISKKKASEVLLASPFSSEEQFLKYTDNSVKYDLDFSR